MFKLLNKIKYWLLAVLGIGTMIVYAAGLPPKNTSFENLPNVAKEQGLYRVTFDQWSEIEIPENNIPEIKLKKWGDETYIKISYPDFDKKVKPKQEDKKLKWKGKDMEVHLYPLELTKQYEKGGFEFEVILKEKPTSNKIVFNIETKGLNFYYQPELTQKEKDEGHFRPDNVIGSYAVYHATKGNMHPSQEEADKYKAGKAFHIYRPKITDAEGNWAWESQIIENGKITITIPQDFLDNAVYPIRSTGETFGYTTLGETGGWGYLARESVSNVSYTQGETFNLSEEGTIDSMSVGVRTRSGYGNENVDLFFVVYREDSAGSGSHDLVASAESLNELITETKSFTTIDFASESLSADDYVLAAIGNGEDVATANNYVITVYDSGEPSRNFYAENTSGVDGYATRKGEDPWGETASSGAYQISIYATYTPAGEEEERRIWHTVPN